MQTTYAENKLYLPLKYKYWIVIFIVVLKYLYLLLIHKTARKTDQSMLPEYYLYYHFLSYKMCKLKVC